MCVNVDIDVGDVNTGIVVDDIDAGINVDVSIDADTDADDADDVDVVDVVDADMEIDFGADRFGPQMVTKLFVKSL